MQGAPGRLALPPAAVWCSCCRSRVAGSRPSARTQSLLPPRPLPLPALQRVAGGSGVECQRRRHQRPHLLRLPRGPLCWVARAAGLGLPEHQRQVGGQGGALSWLASPSAAACCPAQCPACAHPRPVRPAPHALPPTAPSMPRSALNVRMWYNGTQRGKEGPPVILRVNQGINRATNAWLRWALGSETYQAWLLGLQEMPKAHGGGAWWRVRRCTWDGDSRRSRLRGNVPAWQPLISSPPPPYPDNAHRAAPRCSWTLPACWARSSSPGCCSCCCRSCCTTWCMRRRSGCAP